MSNYSSVKTCYLFCACNLQCILAILFPFPPKFIDFPRICGWACRVSSCVYYDTNSQLECQQAVKRGGPAETILNGREISNRKLTFAGGRMGEPITLQDAG